MRLSVDSQTLGLKVIEPRKGLSVGCADVVETAEGNMSISDKASKWTAPRGRRARHDVQCVGSNSGDPCSPLTQGGVWQTTQETEEAKRQRGSRMPS